MVPVPAGAKLEPQVGRGRHRCQQVNRELGALWIGTVTMAKAGARYEVETGNIWGYAHRVRAAVQCCALLLALAVRAVVGQPLEP